MDFKYPSEMSAQEVFDKIVTHLRQQGCKSEGFVSEEEGTRCRYLTADGKKCAAGALLLPEDAVQMEGFRWLSAIASMPKYQSPHSGVILGLQEVHDDHDPSTWEAEFKFTAEAFELVYTPPE